MYSVKSVFVLGFLLIVCDFQFVTFADEQTPSKDTKGDATVAAVLGNSTEMNESSDGEDTDTDDKSTDEDDIKSPDDVSSDDGDEDDLQPDAGVDAVESAAGTSGGGSGVSSGAATAVTSLEQLPASESDLDETSSSPWSIDSPVDFAALKADHELMQSLTAYLGRFGIKMPSDIMNRVDKTDLCSENAIGGLKYYCLKIEDGQYYDPWNPWCSFIECNDGIATRRFCEAYTWMGMGATDNLLMNKNDMCRRRLLNVLIDFRCKETTEFAMCEETKMLEAVGSPKTGITSLQGLAAALKEPQVSGTGASLTGNLSKPSHMSFNVEVPPIDINSLAT